MFISRKTASLAFPIIAAALLSGCGEKEAEVKIPDALNMFVNAGQLEFVSGDLYQLPKEQYQIYADTLKEADEAKDIILGLESDSKLTLSDLHVDTVKTAAEASIKETSDAVSQAQKQWVSYHEEKKSALEKEIVTSQNDIDTSDKNFAAYQEQIKPFEQNITALEKKVEELNNKKNDLLQQYLDATNKDIMDYSLPIRKQTSINLRYSYYKKRGSQCRKEKFDVIEYEGSCYALKPVRTELADKPSFKVGQNIIIDTLKINQELGPRFGSKNGQLYFKLDNAKSDLKKQKIIAQNQHPFKFEPNSWAYQAAERNIKSAKEQLNEIDSKEVKEAFLRSELREETNKLDHTFADVLEKVRQNLVQNAEHDTNVEYAKPITLSSDAKRGLLVYHFKTMQGQQKAFLAPFDAEVLSKSEKPTVETLGANGAYTMSSIQGIDSPELNKFLFNPSSSLGW
ncbi:hypothetical protein [Vibrio viridaestus]|uniref:Uncharacterized protein n=1 Tax=Vibrio viridaestus TaxID=2487322 RepID=A0A3N9THG8_9VIBR|nr:hypothetical protein [Vibrio viridaestus]RQW63687.1 hypothetical protein EES38_10620 [Vibrio viridaestus]